MVLFSLSVTFHWPNCPKSFCVYVLFRCLRLYNCYYQFLCVFVELLFCLFASDRGTEVVRDNSSSVFDWNLHFQNQRFVSNIHTLLHFLVVL